MSTPIALRPDYDAAALRRVAKATRRRTEPASGGLGGHLRWRHPHGRLVMPVSGDTILRLVRAGEPAPYPSPRVVGIDDWAFRRGQSYGTIVCDLERRRVLDLLPGRNAETVATWLKQHPSVEVVARDRAGAYAEGARSGAPGAIQVADRWHLLRNLGDVMQGLVDRHRRHVHAAVRLTGCSPGDRLAARSDP